jgi:hypothetical protein
MSMPGRAPLRAFARRRGPRCALAVPVRVTVMRSGTAYSIPGRSVDLCEGGIAVVLAGEVRVTDLVGVEFLLPDLGLGLQTRAVVRHYSALRCGFEFKDLTRHQQAVIREWARQRLQVKPKSAKLPGAEPAQPRTTETVSRKNPFAGARLRGFFWLAAAVVVLTGLLAWWQWERGWRQLEEQIPRHTGQIIKEFHAALPQPPIKSRIEASPAPIRLLAESPKSSLNRAWRGRGPGGRHAG